MGRIPGEEKEVHVALGSSHVATGSSYLASLCKEICQPFATRIRNRTHGAKVLSGEQVEKTLMF